MTQAAHYLFVREPPADWVKEALFRNADILFIFTGAAGTEPAFAGPEAGSLSLASS